MELKDLGREEKLKILLYTRVDSEIRNIVFAYRGPDLTPSENLKDMYTFPVRVIAREQKDAAKTVLSHMTPFRLRIILEELEEVRGNLKHYLDHIEYAFDSLYRLQLVPKDIYYYVLNTIDAIYAVWNRVSRGDEVTKEHIDEQVDRIRKKYIQLCRRYSIKID